LDVHSYDPSSQLHPWKEVRVSNVVQGQGGRRGRQDSGDLAGGLGRGSSWGGPRGHKGAICVLTRGGERAGGWARRRPAAAAAGVITPASRRLGVANKRGWDLCWCKGEAGAARVSVASVRRVEFTVAAPMADDGARLGVRRQRAGLASSTAYIGTRALERGSRYGTRAVRGATANGSLGAARCA
jgi:hypothetical protein